MAPRKRRALIEAAEKVLSDSDNDSVEENISRRHAKLEELARGSDSESANDEIHPEDVTDGAILDIDLSSDSENDVPIPHPKAAYIQASSDEEDEDVDEDAEEDDGDWGGRRSKYHGGDTAEHEIMEDEERDEVLKEEEDEALRLRRKQLAEMQPSDYGLPDDETNDADDEDSDEEEREDAEYNFKPDLAVLTTELKKYYKLMDVWRNRASWGDAARTRFQLYATYSSYITFYLALLSDSKKSDTDPREHPVVNRLFSLRKLINEHETIPIEVPEPSPPQVEPSDESEEPEKEIPEANGVGEFNESTSAVENEAPVLEDVEIEETEPIQEVSKKKKKKKKKKAKSSDEVKEPAKDDEALVQSLLSRPFTKSKNTDDSDKETEAKQRQRKLNRATGALDSELKNASRRKTQSADVDHVRALPTWREPGPSSKPNPDAMEDAAEIETILNSKRGRKRARKEKEQEPHVYTFNDSVEENARRRATTQVVLNRGLTRYRPKEKKTPRTKNKAAYATALKKRRTVVRDAVAVKPGLSYGGEATGINLSARRSAQLSKF